MEFQDGLGMVVGAVFLTGATCWLLHALLARLFDPPEAEHPAIGLARRSVEGPLPAGPGAPFTPEEFRRAVHEEDLDVLLARLGGRYPEALLETVSAPEAACLRAHAADWEARQKDRQAWFAEMKKKAPNVTLSFTPIQPQVVVQGTVVICSRCATTGAHYMGASRINPHCGVCKGKGSYIVT